MLTITGIDERTNIAEVPENVEEYGLLYRDMPMGQRYPSRLKLDLMTDELLRRVSSISLHVCGVPAFENLLHYRISDLTHYVHRIQVNGQHSLEDMRKIAQLYKDHEIIFQHGRNDIDTDYSEFELPPNCSLLVDFSAGRGVVSTEWNLPKNFEGKVGFAGGINVDNLEAVLGSIENIKKEGWWIDLETGVRDEGDWFSTDKAWEVADKYRELTS